MCSQVYPHHSHPVWLFSSILNCWFLECCLLKLPFTSTLPDTPKSSAVLSVCPMIPFPLLDLVVCFHVLCLCVLLLSSYVVSHVLFTARLHLLLCLALPIPLPACSVWISCIPSNPCTPDQTACISCCPWAHCFQAITVILEF